MPGKLYGLIKNEIGLVRISLDFKPDVFISHNSTMAAHVSTLLCKPHIAIEDTFNKEQTILSVPFTNVVLTGDYPHPSLGRKEVRYPGYHELAYLHPNVFTPDKSVLQNLGVNEGEKYAIVRFVAWNASHDVGHKGISLENKIMLVDKLSRFLKVFISSESELPEELIRYRVKITPEEMHDVLYYAQLIIGESATMASECACLGVPAIYLDNNGRGYTTDQDKSYGLVYNYSESLEDQIKAIEKSIELAQIDNVRERFMEQHNKLLSDKIDVTAFMVWFVENYPNSEWEMRKGNFNFDRFK